MKWSYGARINVPNYKLMGNWGHSYGPLLMSGVWQGPMLQYLLRVFERKQKPGPGGSWKVLWMSIGLDSLVVCCCDFRNGCGFLSFQLNHVMTIVYIAVDVLAVLF